MNDTDTQDIPKPKNKTIGLNDLPDLGGKQKPIGLDDLPDLKKKEDTSKTSAVSPSDSSNAPKQTVTPATTSASNLPSLHESIFGEKPEEKTLRNKQESSFLKTPSVKDISTDPKSLLSTEEKRIQSMTTDEGVKAKVHERVQQFRNNFYNGSLTPDDVELVHGGLEPGVSLQAAADAINLKTKKLKAYGDAPLQKSTQAYVDELAKVNSRLATLHDMAPIPSIKAEYDNLTEKKAFLEHSLTQVADVRIDKAAKDIIGDLQNQLDENSFSGIHNTNLNDLFAKPESPIKYTHLKDNSYVLSEKSQKYIRDQVDKKINANPDAIINTATSGDPNKKDGNYPEIANRVIDYFNTIPVIDNAHAEFTKDFLKEHPEAKGYILHQKEISTALSGDKLKQATAYINTYKDKQAISIGQKYLGDNGILTKNSEFEKIQHKYADMVHAGTITDDVARKQIEAETKNNPLLKNLYKNYEKELNTVQNNVKDMWGKYIQKSLTAIDPNIEINNDGSVGIKGKGKMESKKIIDEYNDGIAKSTAQVLNDQHTALGLSADEKAKRLGSFWGTFGESLNDIQGSFAKYWYDKTGYGGDNVRAFQTEKGANTPISASDEAKKWQYKGVMSLVDPDFYLSKVGSQLPLFAGVAAVSALTEGAGLPESISWLSSAGLFDAQMALSSYNDLATSGVRDVNGNRLTELDAARAAANQFKETVVPDALFMGVNMGILSRAKVIAKPSIGREILSAGKNAAIGAIPMSWQGYLGYANEQQAEGKTPDFWDYAQDGNFAKSLIDGVIGGGIIGLAHIPSSYSKNTENFKRLIYNAEGELKNNSLYNASLQHEMNGMGDKLRDALKVKIATEDWTGREQEKAEVQQALQYSTALKRNIDAAGIDVTDINGAYQAHNLALADLHKDWAEGASGSPHLADIYNKQSKDFQDAAQKVMEGKAKYYYLQDGGDKPIFISDDAFKTMEASGQLKDLMDKKIIKNVIKSDDPEFSAKYKAANENKVSAQKPAEVKLEEKDTDKIITALKGNVDNFSEAGKMMYRTHLDDPKLHEQLTKELISQGIEHPNILRKNIGADAFALIEPIIEKQKEILSPKNKDNAEEIRSNSGQLHEQGGQQKILSDEGSENLQQPKEGGTSPGNEKDKIVSGDRFGDRPIFSDFNSTIADKEGELLPFGEEIKQRIENGEPITIVTRSTDDPEKPEGNNEQRILKALEFETKPDNLKIIQGVSPEEKANLAAKEGAVLIDNSGAVLQAAEGKDVLPVNANELNNKNYEKGNEYIEPEKNQSTPNRSQPVSGEGEIKKQETLTKRFNRIEDVTDPYDRVLQHFGGGGKIHSSAVEELFGNSKKSTESERRARISLVGKDAPNIDQLAHDLWESDPTGRYTTEDYKDAIERVLNEHNSKASMQNDLVDRYDWEAAQEKYNALEMGKEAIGIVDNLSEDEINHILALDADENKKEELDKYIDDLTGKEPPKEPPVVKIGEESTSPEKEWTAVRKQKLAEIDGVKEMFEKRGVKGWTETYESALSNVQAMYPDKSLYDALKARVDHFSDMLDKGTLFNPTSEDNAAFNIFRNLTESKIKDIPGWDSDDEFVRLTALNEFKGYQQDLFNIARVTNPEGEAGRAFNILQSETHIDPDAGLQIRRMELMDAKDGEKLTDDELKWTADQWEKEKALIEKIHSVREQSLKEAFDKQIQALTKEFQEKLKAAKGTKLPAEKAKREKLLSQSGKEFADKIRSGKLKGTYATIPGFPQAVNAVIEAIAQIVEKGAKLADAISQYVKENNIKDEKRFTDDFFGVLNNMEKKTESFDKIKELAEADKVSTVTNKMVAANFIRDYVNSHIGLHEPKDILDAAHEGLKEILPDLTKEKLIEAYLKAGEFKQPTEKKLQSGLRQSTDKLTKIAKLEKDLNDLKNKNNIYKAEKNKTLGLYDKDIASIEKQIKQAMIDSGVKVSNEDQFTKATYNQRAKSHNQRLDDIGKKIDEKLADKNLPDAEKKELIKLKSQLDASKIKLDENSKLSQKKTLDEGKYILKSIKNDFKGDDAIKKDLQRTIDQFDKDKDNSEQDIKLARTKQQLQNDINEYQRKIKAKEFEDKQPITLTKSDAELIKLEAQKNFFQGAYDKKKKEYEKGMSTKAKRYADTLRALEVAYFIGRMGTLLKVTASAALKPQFNALSKLTTGKVFDALPFETTKAISERAKLGGESNSFATVKKLQEAAFRQATEEKLRKVYEKANDDYEKSDHEYQVAKGELENMDKNSSEYKNKEKEVQKLEKINNKNLVSAVGNSMYQFIAGSSLKEAKEVFWHRAAKIDQVFGQFDTEAYDFKQKPYSLDNIGYVLDAFGRSHAALKNFSSRSEFAAGFIARLEGQVAEGNPDLATPDNILKIANASYLDWERGKYGESNLLTDKWNKITAAVDKISPAAAYLMRFDVAITRVPVNMAKEAILEYTAGAFTGSIDAWKAYQKAKGETLNLGYTDQQSEEFKNELKNQLRQLDPKQAATIARAFRKGGFGLGLYALFAIGGISFGGFAHLGQTKEDKEKRDREKRTGVSEIKTEEIKLGNWTLPLWVSRIIEHTPGFAPALNAISLNQVYKNSIKDGTTTYEAVKNSIQADVEHNIDALPQIQKVVIPVAKASLEGLAQNRWDDVDKAGNPIKRQALEFKDYKQLIPIYGNKKEVLSEKYYRFAIRTIEAYKYRISEVENNSTISDQQKEEQRKKLLEEKDKAIELIYENNKKNPQ